jgi:catechol 2,3-dioxygenase-like lactoylglutathione lyase family enzyme
MKRFHVHVSVADLEQSIRFYSTLFASEPAVLKPDYAKWMLDDPRLNFAISTRDRKTGVNHLGLQVDSGEELAGLEVQLRSAGLSTIDESQTTCCYAKADKHWVIDPQGVAWETFHTLDSAPVYGSSPIHLSSVACCGPNSSTAPAT